MPRGRVGSMGASIPKQAFGLGDVVSTICVGDVVSTIENFDQSHKVPCCRETVFAVHSAIVSLMLPTLCQVLHSDSNSV